MHMLHLLRHAKSSWKEEVEDHERRRAAVVARPLPGRLGASAAWCFDLVLYLALADAQTWSCRRGVHGPTAECARGRAL
jgi:hypothetical protein